MPAVDDLTPTGLGARATCASWSAAKSTRVLASQSRASRCSRPEPPSSDATAQISRLNQYQFVPPSRLLVRPPPSCSWPWPPRGKTARHAFPDPPLRTKALRRKVRRLAAGLRASAPRRSPSYPARIEKQYSRRVAAPPQAARADSSNARTGTLEYRRAIPPRAAPAQCPKSLNKRGIHDALAISPQALEAASLSPASHSA